MCGDVSPHKDAMQALKAFTPHVWGCFGWFAIWWKRGEVYPTCVGMFRAPASCISSSVSLPHMCGDVSLMAIMYLTEELFTPHVWGCFDEAASIKTLHDVYPTCVGMFHMRVFFSVSESRLPHMCGDVSPTSAVAVAIISFTPHVWGCFVWHT
ncbi:hypothetical protein DENIS_2414 [Desulfonema ishimotonii]|uniref:Uncharacterized protein n=1 Tax=Desulfonema ishimotonii TaxID=45657 RepID=A0A401FWZ9_9BACT|nr:hypothetical protein DENIS_2414 [Desulfonema ishimotonii]